MYQTMYPYLSDIFEIVEVCKQSDMFSDNFYNQMFDKTMQLMAMSGSSQDVVLVMRLFEDKGDLLEEKLEQSMKEHIA